MDLAILSSRIFTGDPKAPWAEAVAVRENRIAAVGSNHKVKEVCGKRARILELPGRLVTPGFVDAHAHFVSFGLGFQMVDLQNLTSLAACRERIQEAVASFPPGQWVIGRGWDHNKWEDNHEPTRRDLDDITPHNPVMMVRVCTHSIWVNTLALEAAHIDGNTPDPEGGRIERFPDSGNPTGLIREARELIEDNIPEPSLEERKAAALLAQETALRVGVTGLHSCEGLREWEALSELDREEKLKLRIYHMLQPEDLEEAITRDIQPGYGSERLWFGHIKLFADGSMGSGTALMHEPYSDDPSQHGIPFLSPEELKVNIRKAYQCGWDVAVHAIGDKAVTNALEAIQESRAEHPGSRRDRIEHVQLFRPQDLSLFQELGVVASVQPVFVPTDWATADCKWGAHRCRNAYAWRSLLEAQIPLQFGSDTPVESINPLFGLHASVTRQDLRGNPTGGWCPGQRLTLEEAIAGYTHVAAWTSRRQDHLGKLAPGKWADLTVFDRDLTRLSPDEWLEAKVELTIVNGEIVYEM